jgi:hypothetical protein
MFFVFSSVKKKLNFLWLSPFFPVCVNNYISTYGMIRPRTLFLDSFILLLGPNHYKELYNFKPNQTTNSYENLKKEFLYILYKYTKPV